MRPATGETTAAIQDREDAAAWPTIRAELAHGATLYRPPRLDRYVLSGATPGYRGPQTLAPRTVVHLEGAGVLRFAGERRYALAEGK